ncbi:helix-turn-helix transcriptional regulator [Flammeovirga sp. MY04]|uniref:AraC family transcriptional regulator n=1 Tax=Flammeovirga sp. MY04 TaxID=1191459 RepID=UPI0008060CC9|nr:AraC family transcriptional regulator [Flammeovirga sp. MY04]ANQ52530.1 helix-turn-helix transcriptional regulator [Flammeovirga sp. MY04]
MDTILIKEGSAFSLLEQLHQQLGGELSKESLVLNNQTFELDIKLYSLINGADISVYYCKPKQDVQLVIESEENQNDYYIMRFEYDAQIGRNTTDQIQQNSVSTEAMIAYKSFYSFKSELKSNQKNQWVSIRFHKNQIADSFPEFKNILKTLFPSSKLWVKYSIAPIEVHLLLADIFKLDLSSPSPKNNSIILSRLIECIGIFYERVTQNTIQHSLHPEDFDQILKVKEYLMNHLEHQKPTLDELAEVYGYSSSKLKRDFMSVFGISTHNFYQQQRLENAKLLLTTKNYEITDIARKFGYSTVSKFSFAFKKQFGVTPKSIALKYQK